MTKFRIIGAIQLILNYSQSFVDLGMNRQGMMCIKTLPFYLKGQTFYLWILQMIKHFRLLFCFIMGIGLSVHRTVIQVFKP